MKRTISREIVALNNLIKRYLDNKKIDLENITCTNIWIIAYIAENDDRDVFQRDIEKDFGVTRSTASRVVDLMEKKGLVERHSIDSDARLKKLTLTDKSRRIVTEMKAFDDDLNKALRYGIDDEDLAVFYKCIDKMKINLTANREEEVN